MDVSIGKGELGRGFYTGSSIALAAIWAQLRYGNEAVVIEFDILKPRFVLLKGHVVKVAVEVTETWDIESGQRNCDLFIRIRLRYCTFRDD